MLCDLIKNNKLRTIMLEVLIALIPYTLSMCYAYGFSDVFLQLTASISTIFIIESLIYYISDYDSTKNPTDLSGIVTAVLFALSIPSACPVWMNIIGSAICIIVGKHIYGGLGRNIFNPAMLGYCFLLISYPKFMHYAGSTIDMINSATILDSLHTHILIGTPQLNIMLHNYAWLYINLSAILGGLYLLYRGTITHELSLGFIVSLAIVSQIMHLYDSSSYANVMTNLLSGGTMLSAFFIITDPVSSPANKYAKYLFGSLIALIAYVIRCFGSYPDGLCFAILIMNALTPIFNEYI